MASVFFKLRIDPAASAVSLPATAESIEDLPIGLANLFKPGDLLAQARPIPEGAASFLKNATEYHAGVGTRFDARTGSVVADAYGIARLGADGCSLTLKPPVVTNADASRAWLLMGQGADGTYPGLDLIYSTLVECGFERPFPPEQLGPQLTAITTGQAWLAVAAGTAPIDGSTEWHELLVDPERPSSGQGAGGRIDYRERRRFVTVKVGQPLVKIHPERPGVAGIDGVLCMDVGTLAVLPVLYVPGDVGLETGNVRFTGSVKIAGSVQRGMLVEAEGDVFVEGMVDGGTVLARGSIIVSGGIVGYAKNKVRSGKDVTARFIQNANVFAGGDILVGQAVVNSFLFSGDTVAVLGEPGAIRSGIVVARSRIEGNEVGSGFDLTVLRTGLREEHKERRKRIEESPKRLNERNSELLKMLHVRFGVVSVEQIPAILADLPTTRRGEALPLVQELAANGNAGRKMRAYLQALGERLAASERSSIVVRGIVHAGVRIVIDERVKEVEKDMREITFTQETV